MFHPEDEGNNRLMCGFDSFVAIQLVRSLGGGAGTSRISTERGLVGLTGMRGERWQRGLHREVWPDWGENGERILL